MDVADAETQRIADNWQNPYAMDSGNLVHFSMLDIENTEKSKEAGYPVYESMECICIKAPGSLTQENIIPLRKEWQRRHYIGRYPRHYAAFKAGLEDPTEGYPLKNWPPMAHSRGELDLYAFHGVKTIQALAAITDGNITTFGASGRKRREQAKGWLEHAQTNAPMAKLNAKNQELENKLEVALRAIETLQKEKGLPTAPVVELAPAAPKPKRVRNKKPKSEEQST